MERIVVWVVKGEIGQSPKPQGGQLSTAGLGIKVEVRTRIAPTNAFEVVEARR